MSNMDAQETVDVLNRRAARPRPRELYQTLRAQIEQGDFVVGCPFPTEEQLRAEHQVSRYALREALHQLESDGFIRRRQGSGATVISRTKAKLFRHIARSHEDLMTYALATRVHWHEMRNVRTDSKLARLLGCDESRRWQYLRGTRREDSGEPLCVVQIYVDAAMPALPPPIEFGDEPIYRWMERHTDTSFVGFSQDILAKILNATEAEQLNDRAGAATLQMVRRYIDQSDAVQIISVSTYRSHDFVYNLCSVLQPPEHLAER